MTEMTTTDKGKFLKSTAANIEDWNGGAKVFQGGETQLYNPNFKVTPATFME